MMSTRSCWKRMAEHKDHAPTCRTKKRTRLCHWVDLHHFRTTYLRIKGTWIMPKTLSVAAKYWLGAFAKPFAMLLHSSPFFHSVSFCFGRAFAFTTEFISLSFAIVSLFAFASTVFSLSPPCALHGCSRIVSKSKHCKSTKPQNHTSEASELAKPHGKDL